MTSAGSTVVRLCRILALIACTIIPGAARAVDPPATPDCGVDDLLAGKAPSQAEGLDGNPTLATDGSVAPEGALWDAPPALKLASGAGWIIYDLGRPYPISAIYLQADANDTYRITGSLDASPGSFKVITDVPSVLERGHGLRFRALQILPVTARYLRIGEARGDGFFSISELAVYCRAPTPFPAPMRIVDAPMAVGVPAAAEIRSQSRPQAPKAALGPLELIIAAALLVLVAASWFSRRRRSSTDQAASANAPASAPEAVHGTESNAERFFPIVFLLFVGSGCAALIYEIVWFQLLQLVLGSSAISIGVLLGTFMGGMCIGSLGLSRFVARSRHPLRVYAVLELAIAVCALLMLVVMPLIQGIYTTSAGHGVKALLLRGLLAAICLLPPTVLMGATLPAVARWVRTTPSGVSWLGYFYGGNTLGAVLGCLVAGFYLLRVHDMPTATYAAVALNALVAGGALWLARLEPAVTPDTSEALAVSPSDNRAAWPVYLTIGLSGMCALSAEVIWTRLFTLLLSGNTYTFSIILAVFLVGIGLGSGAGSLLAGLTRDPRRALGIAQLALIAAIAWTAWNVTTALPFWPINVRLASSPWYQFQLDLVRCVWAILPAACLWGASFPLALAAVAQAGPDDDGGVVVGRVYAANTVGAIVGALGTSLLLIPWLGTQNGHRILIVMSAIAGAVMLFPRPFADSRSRRGLRVAIAALAVVELAAIAARNVAPVPTLLIGFGRFSAEGVYQMPTFVYVGEGMNSSLAVSRMPNGVMSYHNAGKVQASSQPQDMRLQRMLGHLTTLLPKQPRDVLVIACGAGVTAGAASIDPRVERLTIAEIEPLVPSVVAKYFGKYNFDVVRNPKVHIEVDDARHFLNTTDQKFDAITSDPFDPWVKGAATLYTKEFWELVKRHLKPGGVVTVFVQLYDSGMEAVKSEIVTFFEVFPNGIIWGNTVGGEGYDVVLSGQLGEPSIDVDAMELRLTSPEFAKVAQSLREIGFDSAVALLSTYGGRAAELKPWLHDAQVNRDNNLRLQFLAGFGMNHDQRAEIYRGVLAYRRYPERLFVGSPERLQALSTAMLGKPR